MNRKSAQIVNSSQRTPIYDKLIISEKSYPSDIENRLPNAIFSGKIIILVKPF